MAASPSTARAMNDRLALSLLQDEGPLTAGQLRDLTGLSRPTIADLVERLRSSGLVTVVGEASARRRGPNARLYGIAADRAHLAALDVRTEGVTVAVSDLLGTVLAEASVPIGHHAPAEPAVARAVSLVEESAAAAGAGRLHSVAIGAPGLIDPASGQLRDTTGLPVWHRSLVAALKERLPARVVVENETNLAALAERRDGAARGRDTFVLMWIGAGVGAAVMLDGTLRRGASGGAGEIGFLPVPLTGGLPSAVGCENGFHALVGSAAITELAREHGLSAEPREHEPAGAACVREGLAREADAFLDDVAGRLAVGVASVSAVLDPGCVVLGGEIGQAGGPGLAARVVDRLAGISPLTTEVRASELGGRAVLRGAVLTALAAAQDDLFPPPAP